MLIKNYKLLADSAKRKKALDIINHGLEACKADKIIKQNITLKKGLLYIKGKKYDLKKFNNVYLIGFGN